jgi:phosphate butyryltransferase
MDFESLKSAVQQSRSRTVIAVAHAVDPSIFRAAKTAIELSLADFHFIGPFQEMTDAMKDADFEEMAGVTSFTDCTDEKEAAETAVRLVSHGEADVLMKGMVSTSVLLKSVLHKEYGLRTGNVLSHIAGFEMPGREKVLFLTDAAMNIAPDLKEKVQIVENAVSALHQMGMKKPKAALLAAVETVNPAMPATLDAAAITQMNRRGQIGGCVVDGPLGFDNAVSAEAAARKKIMSPVAGDADIIVAPEIETGNSLYKSFTYIGKATAGGMIVGARAPIVLTSRTDTEKSRLLSIVMAAGSRKFLTKP